MIGALVLGVVSVGVATVLFRPQSQGLIAKLRELVDAAQQQNPSLFATQVQPIAPFVDGVFKHNRITGILRADLSGFGPGCEQQQREARGFDRRAHLAMLPVLVYLAGLALWFALR